MNGVHQMSADAYEKLAAEIAKLESVDRAQIAEKIGEARDDGDLKENAEYHAAKDEQSFLETRILHLRDFLDNAEIVEATESKDEIGYGSTFTLVDLDSDKQSTYTIVSSYEQDVAEGKLSTSSPLGEAVAGTSPGETTKVTLPNGSEREFKIVSIA